MGKVFAAGWLALAKFRRTRLLVLVLAQVLALAQAQAKAQALALALAWVPAPVPVADSPRCWPCPGRGLARSRSWPG